MPTIDRSPRPVPAPRADGTAPATGPQGTSAPATPGGSGPRDTFASGGTAGGVAGRVRAFVAERTFKELRSGVDLGASTSTDITRLGVRLSQRVFTDRDPQVKDNPLRAATSARLARPGKDIVWAETGGLIKGGPDLSTSIPVSGLVNVNAGFMAQGLLEYRAVVPREISPGRATDVFSRHNLKLPLTAADAQGLEPGSTVELIGKGTARLSAGAGAGTGASTSGVGIDARLGVGHARTRTATWGVEVTRLDGDKVQVKLTEVKERRRDTNLSARAHVDVNPALLAADLSGGFDPATAAVDAGPITDADLGDKSLLDVIGDRGADVLESAVKRFTAFHAQAGVTAREERRDEVTYVLDLKDPSAQKAYEALIRLDTDAADRLAQKPHSGVTQSNYSAITDETEGSARVRFAGKKLLLFNALRSETNATTSGPGQTTRLVRTSRYARNYTGIVSGKKSVLWEGVNVQNAGGGSSTNYFHMRFQNDDKVTRNQELRTFVRFADALGVDDADERRIVMPSAPWIGRLFSSSDDTQVDVDVYFSDDGVRKIVQSDANRVRQAYAEAMGQLDPALAGVDPNRPGVLQLADDYADAKKEARRGGGRDDNHMARSKMSRLSREYRRDTGRDLDDDVDVLRGAKALAGHVQNMGTAGNEAGWASLFADLGQAERFDYMPSIVALKNLAGKDETLVHDVRLQGQGILLRAVDEGALSHPEPVRG